MAKIFVACHKEAFVPENGVIKAVQAGAAGGRIADMAFFDDAGENISDMNDRFSELTVQYYAWKNMEADSLGFFHYRRYLALRDIPSESRALIRVPRFDRGFMEYFGLESEERIEEFLERYDIIVPKPVPVKSVYAQYRFAPGHDIRDLDFCLGYIRNNCPGYAGAADEYMRSRRAYFWNCYIMKKELFTSYCEWLFPILFAFDAGKDYSRAGSLEKRAAGFLAERLFGVFITRLRCERPELRVKETPAALIAYTGADYAAQPSLKPYSPKKEPLLNRAADFLFPRGTRRREFLKRVGGKR